MKKHILWALVVLVIIAMGIYVLAEVDLSVLQRLSLLTIVSLSLLTLLAGVINAIGVRLILRGLGYHVSLKDVYLVNYGSGTASLVGNLKLGIPARVFLYLTVLDIPLPVGTVSIVLETTIWLLIMGVIVAIGIPTILGAGGWVSSLFAFALVIIVVTAFSSLSKIEAMIPEKLFNLRTSKVRDFIASFRQGISTIKKTELIKAICVLTPNYLIEAFSLYIILKELGWTPNIFNLLFVIVFSYLVGLLSLMPMGIGTQDVSLVLLLTQLGSAKDVAMVAALIYRVVRIVIPVIVGLISINILGINRFRNLRDVAAVGEAEN